jgi:hypothetical protein
MQVTWMGAPPSECDICSHKITSEFYDARTRTGQWGCLCNNCFNSHGVGLGLGKGQHYEKMGTAWVKVDG